MKPSASFVAVDLGASSGRVMDCCWNGSTFSLDEVHRFANAGVQFGGQLHWDVLRIWREIQDGLKRLRNCTGADPASISVDAWGVDFALLDIKDRLIGNPYHYRDARTKGIPRVVNSTVNAKQLFINTGVQDMEINTSFQLASMVIQRDFQIYAAETLLMIPDLFQFLLSGEKRAEYTEATTTQLFSTADTNWSREIIAALQIPGHIFPDIVMPGERFGTMLPHVAEECGFSNRVACIATASHDTANAVAAIPGMDNKSVFLSSGTWSLMGIQVDQPNTSDDAFFGGFTNEGAADGGVCLMKNLTGLWLLQECARIWSAGGIRHSWSDLEQAASTAPALHCFIDPSAPELQAPTDMSEEIRRQCAVRGEPIPRTPGEIARCIFESLCFAYRDVIEHLEEITRRKLETVRMVGGGCLNHLLCQMTADACRRVVVAGPVEAAALGNAVIQAVAGGFVSNMAEGRAALQASYDFQNYVPSESAKWDEAFERFKGLKLRTGSLKPSIKASK
jgi:rhamnulokinase